jgi:hypothetical protein
MLDAAEKNTPADAMMSAYRIVHAIGNTQLGGVRGDWLRDLYQFEFGLETIWLFTII